MKAQHTITVDATLDGTDHSISITQEIEFLNTSEDALSVIYLSDWAHGYSSKTTPLAKRFAENFKSSFHFEKDEKRGRTDIQNITTANGTTINWQRSPEVDIIEIPLDTPLLPGTSTLVKLVYKVKLPEDKFTRYGVTREKNYKLKHWLITPAVYNGEWHLYSNKNSDDYFQIPSNFDITFSFPKGYSLFSDLNVVDEQILQNKTQINLKGDLRMHTDLYLERDATFKSVLTDQVEVVTNLTDKKVTSAGKALLADRVTRFLEQKLGAYPHDKILISETDYRISPVYGLNQLPDFISPFPNGFELDMELLKSVSRKYIINSMGIDPHENHWLIGAMQIYLMMEYADSYYPEMKLLGSVSNFFIIRWSHISELEFNDQYTMLYMNMARNNLHQSLSTTKDSLVKFNKNIASDYYAGEGFQYLGDFIGKPELEKSIRDYFEQYKTKLSDPADFKEVVAQNTTLPIDWFFDEYVVKRTTLDFKIKKIEEVGDSLRVSILSKRNNTMPVSIYGLNKNKDVVFKKWVNPIDSMAQVLVPKEDVKKLVLNHEAVIPELNRRNNTKKVNGLFNRPLQFRLMQDVEDPEYNQLFFMPEFQYNLYDGFSVGVKAYNKTFFPRGLSYKVVPQYGFNSKTIIGKGSISFTRDLDQENHYSTRFGISGNTYSYNVGLFYRRLSPFITFAFRDNDDLRKNKRQYINLRNVNIFRDIDVNDPDQEPNYSVFNLQYVYSDKNLVNYYRGVFDYQISQKFSKVSTQFEYRKLFNSNRQLNLRFYAGAFLFNDSGADSDFFSFALDRPTDYLFDYNYYGRSEDTGLFSQQLIIAEGGFKSQLEQPFANQFIATLNGSTNIWKWIYAYGDIGVVKNKGKAVKGVWDTGIRANLVVDYFEIYFPLYSNLGWEPGQPNYDQKIRFIVTLDLRTLLSLFSREWY